MERLLGSHRDMNAPDTAASRRETIFDQKVKRDFKRKMMTS